MQSWCWRWGWKQAGAALALLTAGLSAAWMAWATGPAWGMGHAATGEPPLTLLGLALVAILRVATRLDRSLG